MKIEKPVKTIEYQFNQGNLFAGGDWSAVDCEASARTYTELVTKALNAAYPGAKITITNNLNMRLCLDPFDDLLLKEEVMDTIREVEGAIYQDFNAWVVMETEKIGR